MKIIKRLSIVTIFIGLALLNTTCNKKLFTKITWQGYVYDTIGGKPVKGVWVALNACDAYDSKQDCYAIRIGQAVSNAMGHFYIHNEAARSDRYSIYVNELSISHPFYEETAADILKVDTIYLKN